MIKKLIVLVCMAIFALAITGCSSGEDREKNKQIYQQLPDPKAQNNAIPKKTTHPTVDEQEKAAVAKGLVYVPYTKAELRSPEFNVYLAPDGQKYIYVSGEGYKNAQGKYVEFKKSEPVKGVGLGRTK